MKKKIFACLAVSLFVASIASAGQMQTFTSGSRLQMDCAALGKPANSNVKKMLDATCLTYIKGVFDMHQTYSGGGIAAPRFCKPVDVDLGQMARIVIAYIERNPEKAEMTASSLIMRALGEAFPCNEDFQPSGSVK